MPTNCRRCGKLFNKTIDTICPSCLREEEKQFDVLREYILENRTATISEVADATKVPPKRILRYIREGRLIVPEGMNFELNCKQCDAIIYEGNYCGPCTNKMVQNLSGAYGGTTPTKAKSEPKSAPASEGKKGPKGYHTTDSGKKK